MDSLSIQAVSEFNPNAIILLSLTGEVKYLNLFARTQFPTITAEGTQHQVLVALMQKLKDMAISRDDIILFSHYVNYLDQVYEQQVFVISAQDTIFIYMNDVTDLKHYEIETHSDNAELI